MASYGNFNINKKNKRKKAVITVVCVIVVLLGFIYCIGLTAGSGNEETERISSAVAENTRLKQEVSELEADIIRMQEEIDGLKAELDARPTMPAQYELPQEEIQTPVSEAPLSPRDGI